MHGPDPKACFPFPGADHTVFIKNVITASTIEAGDYSYYNDPDNPERFQEKCVRYHFDFLDDKLIIGRFCAFAAGVQFIMNGANHALNGFSTYPFEIFQNGWEKDLTPDIYANLSRGDTIIGHDVWIGTDATILPGVTIGSGAIVGSKAVVGSDVPPYAIAAGNPARPVKRRFDDRTVERLLEIAWWDWPIEKVTRHLPEIRGADIEALEKAAKS
ncbi:CatB-related O-acetyltransferase [Roseibium sp. RKSG952]|uniref:CatB-related O-acetyltransferase n=1 Tax=Roseibium sp. RKSG952 TaxID=2529384 RepID=UPI0012BB6E4C|nr:CatB-related O-acetyltransferase [Roseibium sp. RKSG952]MTH97053.1 CatB-related O-acetyltransferase [Roseibium sp. RKSG952]